MSTILKELREQLEVYPMGELRKKAVENFGLRLTREDTKDIIIDRIIAVASKNNYAKVVQNDGMPEPGWTRIRAFPVAGRPQTPFFVAVNGYHVYIPFNVDVDVPHKIVEALQNAVEKKVETDFETGAKSWTSTNSYPINVIASTPGPDPRPGFEVQRERKLAAKRAFEEREGYWPKDSEIKELRTELARARAMKDVMANPEK